MTEKLYYLDSHLFEFTAIVSDIINADGKTQIILDKTAFFPEGGGQQCDTGCISDLKVVAVSEKDEIIYHTVESPCGISIGDEVFCKIDKATRFSRMQAHSGEHIVSGIAHSLYGVNNVGFHMDELLMTVDFDKPLSKDDIIIIENKANECVFDNVKVTARLVENDKLRDIDFRSKIDFPGPARIVEIEGVDKCACCAPHVNFTGEIGIIKILSCISHRGGVRLTMICGNAALSDYQSKHRQTLNIASLLCARHTETDLAVEQLTEANKELKYKINEEKSRYISYIASEFTENKAVLSHIYSDLSMDEIRELSNLIKDKSEKAVLLFSGNDVDGYSYCLFAETVDIRALIKDINSSLNGTGGGRPPMAQGKVRAIRTEIEGYLKELKVEAYENA